MNRSVRPDAAGERVMRFTARTDAGAPLLVLLHDDGVDERAMSRIGRGIWPGAPLLRVRGTVATGAGWRFLRCETHEAARWTAERPGLEALERDIARIARTRELALVELVVVGIGGGADAAIGMICRGRRTFTVALLYRPRRVWHVPPGRVRRHAEGMQVCLLAAGHDSRVAAVGRDLQAAGAAVSLLHRDEPPAGDASFEAERRWLHAQLR